MNKLSAVREPGQEINIDNIIESFQNRLPSIAKGFIWRSLVTKSKDINVYNRNLNFFNNPDSIQEHEPTWHQWGVVTHTSKVQEYYRDKVPHFLQSWGVAEEVRTHLSEKIEGVSKEDLLRLSIVFHDLGKFTRREVKTGKHGVPEGQYYVSFRGHEEDSGKIIREPVFSRILKKFGFTESQIEYIARCAELHYKLGVVRQNAKDKNENFSISYTHSETFRNAVLQVMNESPEYKLEIGLLFLADSLAKTEIHIEADTDDEIESQENYIDGEIIRLNLNPKIKNVAKQLPINIAVAKKYFEIWKTILDN